MKDESSNSEYEEDPVERQRIADMIGTMGCLSREELNQILTTKPKVVSSEDQNTAPKRNDG